MGGAGAGEGYPEPFFCADLNIIGYWCLLASYNNKPLQISLSRPWATLFSLCGFSLSSVSAFLSVYIYCCAGCSGWVFVFGGLKIGRENRGCSDRRPQRVWFNRSPQPRHPPPRPPLQFPFPLVPLLPTAPSTFPVSALFLFYLPLDRIIRGSPFRRRGRSLLHVLLQVVVRRSIPNRPRGL